MVRKALLALLVAVCFAIPAVAQAVGGDYLDVFIVKVKPEKQADFEALARKIADANRKSGGDKWLALQTVYGDNTTVEFISHRNTYADIDKAQDTFMGAMNKAYGKDMSQKMLNEWNNYVSGSRSELRKRRWDLSRKAPADNAAWAKMVGESRVLRTTVVHIKPGHGPEFEALLKDLKAAGEKSEKAAPLLVSQSIEGTRGTTYYLTGLRMGMAGFDSNPTTKEMLGEEGYKKYLQSVSEHVEGSDSMVLRFAADLSAPPDNVVAVAPDFWNPKPVMAAKAAKPKSPVESAAKKDKQ